MYQIVCSGALPPSWGDMDRIFSLDLGHNQFVGPIPGEWSRMSKIQKVDLSGDSSDPHCSLALELSTHLLALGRADEDSIDTLLAPCRC